MESSSTSLVFSRRDKSVDLKRQHLESSSETLSDAKYVYDTRHQEFESSKSQRGKLVPQVKYKMKLPAIAAPLEKLSQSVVIIFFPGKLPSANDIAQWIKSLLGGCFIDGVYFASRGFYEVHLTETSHKQKLLEMSRLFYGKQMVHVLPWSPNKDYQSLIRHSCPVWVEVVHFPDMRNELPDLAASLGQVICPRRPTGNRKRFCILWDTDVPTPTSIAVEVEDIDIEEKYFELKWGVFAWACFTCQKFGTLDIFPRNVPKWCIDHLPTRSLNQIVKLPLLQVWELNLLLRVSIKKIKRLLLLLNNLHCHL